MSIFSTHPLHPQVTAALQELGSWRVASAPTAAAILAQCGDAEIVVVRAPIPSALVTQESQLRALIRHGAGLDMIPVDTATAAGVIVANVPGANAVTVAEHAIWSAAALLRCYPCVAADLRGRGWDAARAHSDRGRELSHRTIGILGMGAIGREVARIARNGFGMTVVCHTRRASSVPVGAELLPLCRMLDIADVLVLCAPLTEETRGILDARAFARMKPGAVLVNVARGPLLDEPALIEALTSGRLAGAALDVFAQQPLPTDHPLLSLPNVILTPHMAGITEESMLRMGMGVVAEARRIVGGDLPLNFVNPEVLPAYRARFPV